MSIRSSIDRQLRKFEKQFKSFNNISISRSAILHNFDYFQSVNPAGYVIPVLKANAYGHGIFEITTILKERNFPYIAVDGFYESLTIHNISKQRVLVMGAIQPDNFARMDFERVAIVVHDDATVEALGSLKKKIKVHIELETGMARHGVSTEGLPAFLSLLSKYPTLEIEGVMTHLADADNPNDDSYDDEQVELFDRAVEKILSLGIKPKYFHIAQSAGSTKIVSKYANTLRVGIALYGINPLVVGDKSYDKLSKLKPALQLTSTITKVVKLDKGNSVGYSRTFIADKPTRVGVIPLGYYEGLPRTLSNVGLVQYGNDYLNIVGRICMNHTMIDLASSGAQVGDEVVVYSFNQTSKIAIDNLCHAHGLFNYSLLAGINQNIRRRIVD